MINTATTTTFLPLLSRSPVQLKRRSSGRLVEVLQSLMRLKADHVKDVFDACVASSSLPANRDKRDPTSMQPFLEDFITCFYNVRERDIFFHS